MRTCRTQTSEAQWRLWWRKGVSTFQHVRGRGRLWSLPSSLGPCSPSCVPVPSCGAVLAPQLRPEPCLDSACWAHHCGCPAYHAPTPPRHLCACPSVRQGEVVVFPHHHRGHEATETGLAYAPVSQAHGHNHIVQFTTTGGGGGSHRDAPPLGRPAARRGSDDLPLQSPWGRRGWGFLARPPTSSLPCPALG